MHIIKNVLVAAALAIFVLSPALAQRRHHPQPSPVDTTKPKLPAFPGFSGPKQGPKPYKEVITDKAVSHTGLFTVHKVDDKWYFEIPDSILGRDIFVSTRYGNTAAGGNYGGE